MAKRFWGLNKGQHETDVTQGAADLNTDVEVEVNLASFTGDAGSARMKVLEALESIRNVIIKGNWPPA